MGPRPGGPTRRRVVIGLVFGLSLVVPSVLVSAALERVGARGFVGYLGQLVTVTAILFAVAWYQRRGNARDGQGPRPPPSGG